MLNDHYLLDVKNMFAHVFRHFRLEKGFSMQQAAQLSGLSLHQWQELENGEQWPQLHTVHKICNSLHIPQKDFYYTLAQNIQNFCGNDPQISATDHL